MPVAVAVGCSGYALGRKWFVDPQITGNKGRRSGGTSVAYENCEDAPPFWSGAKTGSIYIFGDKSNPILDNKMGIDGNNTVTMGTYTVELPAGSGDDDEEEEDVEDVVGALSIIEDAAEVAIATAQDLVAEVVTPAPAADEDEDDAASDSKSA